MKTTEGISGDIKFAIGGKKLTDKFVKKIVKLKYLRIPFKKLDEMLLEKMSDAEKLILYHILPKQPKETNNE